MALLGTLQGRRRQHELVGLWWGLCLGLMAVAVALAWRFERLAAGTVKPLEGRGLGEGSGPQRHARVLEAG